MRDMLSNFLKFSVFTIQIQHERFDPLNMTNDCFLLILQGFSQMRFQVLQNVRKIPGQWAIRDFRGIHPSIRAVDPRQGFAPPPPGSHTPHAPLWCLARLPALISFPHPPQVTILTCPPPPNPNPTSCPPTSTLQHALTCLAYFARLTHLLHPPHCLLSPSPTSPSPVRPTRTTPNVAHPLSLHIETPPTSLTLQPPPLFIYTVHLLMHN